MKFAWALFWRSFPYIVVVALLHGAKLPDLANVIGSCFLFFFAFIVRASIGRSFSSFALHVSPPETPA